jgi:hypothetical protein
LFSGLELPVPVARLLQPNTCSIRFLALIDWL